MPTALAVAPPKGSLDRLLSELPAMVARLVENGTPQEIVDARHRTEVLRAYAAKSRQGLQVQNAVAEARLELEGRLGELLAERLSRGRPKSVPSEDTFRLEDLGISRNLSQRCQEISAIQKRVREN